MNQEEFYYLYINVNCLAELGLLELETTRKEAPCDISLYLNKAYAQQEAQLEQANKAYQRANIEALDHSLHLMPKPLPPIHKKMNVEDMQQWKQRFSICDDNVLSLVAEVTLLSVA